MAASFRTLNCLRKLGAGGLRSQARLLPRVFNYSVMSKKYVYLKGDLFPCSVNAVYLAGIGC